MSLLPKACGRILHYLGSRRAGDSCLLSRSAMTAQEYTDWEQRRRDSRNGPRRSKFLDSDVPPPHIGGSNIPSFFLRGSSIPSYVAPTHRAAYNNKKERTSEPEKAQDNVTSSRGVRREIL